MTDLDTQQARVKYLIDKEQVSRYKLSKGAGIAQSTIHHILNHPTGNPSMQKKTIDKLAKFFEVSPQWLEYGDDESISDNTISDNAISDIVTPDDDTVSDNVLDEGHPLTYDEYMQATKMGIRLIPEYDEPFRGGNQGNPLIEDVDYIVGYWTLNGIKADRIIPVTGDSMSPTYPAGSRLAIKRYYFTPDEPFSIPFGEIFAFTLWGEDVDDAPFGFIKRLRKHPDRELAHDYWLAQSDNPNYDDFNVRISQVSSLWRVLAGVKIGS